MNDLAKQVFEQATMLQKRYMNGFKAGQASVVNKELLELLKEWERNIPRMADETPAENSLRGKTLQAIAKAEGKK